MAAKKGYSINKIQKGVFHFSINRFIAVVLVFILQVLLLFALFFWFERFAPHYVGSTLLLSFGMALYILNSDMGSSAKMTWLIIIMVTPIAGTIMFTVIYNDWGHNILKKKIQNLQQKTKEMLTQEEAVVDSLRECSPQIANLAHYIGRSGTYPVYRGNQTTYFSSGKEKLAELLKQLETAKEYIFLEYFIVAEGEMWGAVLDVLERKVKEGVEVRVIYDGSCEFTTLPKNYPNYLREKGIQCKVFAPITPMVSTYYNFRDHRKIVVIDGITAFTGGINLADEYIDVIEKHGKWKDTAIMIQGEAVKSFALMFLQMWDIDEEKMDYQKYLSATCERNIEEPGFVLPYADSPMDNDKVGERVYMDIINHAKQYVHIMTPYLILDTEMETAIKFAAERGVDVRIIIPGIPDKKSPYALAKTHFKSLLKSGVKVYTYTPGFVHAKVVVSDDKVAVAGTINFDYRSFCHHFECAVLLYQEECISDMEYDFQSTLKECELVTEETIKNEKLSVKLGGYFLKMLSPLM